MKYYESFDSRFVFGRVEDMFKWAGLYDLIRRSLEDELFDVGLFFLLIEEFVIVRIFYFFSVVLFLLIYIIE